jgi:hypothetical protein
MSKIIIDKISFNQMATWTPKIQAHYKDLPIVLDTKQKQDMIITYHNEDDPMRIRYKIAIELKYKDLHSTMNGHGEGGNLSHELQTTYLPLLASKDFSECWIVIACGIEIPFAKQRQTILKYIDNLSKPKARKVKSPEEISELIQTFEDDSMILMNFIHAESLEMRDLESVYSLAFQSRIPIYLAESQEKALDKILELIYSLDQPIELNKPIYTNWAKSDSETSQFETSLRSYPNFTSKRLEQLYQWLDEKKFTHSWMGINSLSERLEGPIHLIDKFWVDWWQSYVDGKNPLTIKERKDLEKESN